jgi:hypothetical protein
MANEKQHKFEIRVNTRPKEWEKDTISFQEVVILAFGTYSEDPNIRYTVEYSHGPDGHREGSLTKGQSVPLKRGMIFDVTESNKS